MTCSNLDNDLPKSVYSFDDFEDENKVTEEAEEAVLDELTAKIARIRATCGEVCDTGQEDDVADGQADGDAGFRLLRKNVDCRLLFENAEAHDAPDSKVCDRQISQTIRIVSALSTSY